jgi:hypothetical protein
MVMSADFDPARELGAIHVRLNALDNFIVRYSDGYGLDSEGEAQFRELVTSASSILDEALGESNRFSLQIGREMGQGYGGYPPAFSKQCLINVRALVGGGALDVKRRAGSAAAPPTELERGAAYVNPERISELRQVTNAGWDTIRLVRLCEELNAAHATRSYLTVPMQVRAILDQVPPIFGQTSFAQVIGQHGGAAFKKQMTRLEESSRKVADTFLHQPIRKSESIPVFQDVDFRAELGSLLAEVCRLLRERS